jgi:transposase
MARKFMTVDYEEILDLKVSLRDVVPFDHLARFVVRIVAQLDLDPIYCQYNALGAPPYAPEILLALLFYGYATGVFSSRKIEKATYESIPFRFIAGNLHPDHDTLADFRKTFLPEIQELFVQILVLAQAAGLIELGNISLDGSKIHADASKSKAVSYNRLLELKALLQQEVQELLALGEQADQAELPEGLKVEEEIAFRQQRLANLTQAQAVLEVRAQERYEAEMAEYEAKVRAREEKAQQTGRSICSINRG